MHALLVISRSGYSASQIWAVWTWYTHRERQATAREIYESERRYFTWQREKSGQRRRLWIKNGQTITCFCFPLAVQNHYVSYVLGPWPSGKVIMGSAAMRRNTSLLRKHTCTNLNHGHWHLVQCKKTDNSVEISHRYDVLHSILTVIQIQLLATESQQAGRVDVLSPYWSPCTCVCHQISVAKPQFFWPSSVHSSPLFVS